MSGSPIDDYKLMSESLADYNSICLTDVKGLSLGDFKQANSVTAIGVTAISYGPMFSASTGDLVNHLFMASDKVTFLSDFYLRAYVTIVEDTFDCCDWLFNYSNVLQLTLLGLFSGWIGSICLLLLSPWTRKSSIAKLLHPLSPSCKGYTSGTLAPSPPAFRPILALLLLYFLVLLWYWLPSVVNGSMILQYMSSSSSLVLSGWMARHYYCWQFIYSIWSICFSTPWFSFLYGAHYCFLIYQFRRLLCLIVVCIWSLIVLSCLSSCFIGYGINDIVTPAFSYMTTTSGRFTSSQWIFDSGSTHHMTSNRQLLHDVRPTHVRIRGIGGFTVATLEGTIFGESLDVNGKWVPIRLARVLYCPDLDDGVNLISMRQVRQSGATISIGGRFKTGDGPSTGSNNSYQRSYIQRSSQSKYALLEDVSGLLCLHIHVNGVTSVYDGASIAQSYQAAGTPAIREVDINVFHTLYGHISLSYLQLLAKRSHITLTGTLRDCAVCATSKLRRHSIGKATSNRSTKYLGRVFTDLCGPLTSSLGGSRYVQLFVDDYSRKQWVFFLKDKSMTSVASAIQQFLVNNPGVEIIRSDNGSEFANHRVQQLLLDFKVKHEWTPDYSPEYNGVVERRLANLRIIATTLLGTANLYGHHRKLWSDAMSYSVRLANNWPCAANPSNKSPNDMLKLSDKATTFTWGSVCYLLKRNATKAELDERGEKGLFLGYTLEDPAVARVYKFSTHSIVTTPDFVVHEGVHFSGKVILNTDVAQIFSGFDIKTVGILVEDTCDALNESSSAMLTELSSLPSTSNYTGASYDDTFPDEHPFSSGNTDFPTGSTRSGLVRGPSGPVRREDLTNDVEFDDINQNPGDLSTMADGVALCALLMHDYPSDIPVDFGFAFLSTANNFSRLVTPRSYAEAISGPQAKEWIASMEEEFNSLIKNLTWELVPLPSGNVNVVGSKWVYLIKFDQYGNVRRYKSRFVAQGFSQKYRIDYFDTYAPVVGMTTVRMLLATATSNGWPVFQLDVETAFLNAAVAETIYVKQALGHVVGINHVYLLKKSLYGLKQSPYNWNVAVHEWLISFGFQANSADQCLYSMTDASTGKRIILTLYVDDIILTGDWECQILLFKQQLKERFIIKDLGLLQFCLGLNVEYDRIKRIMHVTQTHYIDQLLVRFNMEHCAPLSTPGERFIAKVDSEWHLQNGLEQGESEVTQFPYRELIGCLLYVAMSTRPDIANSVRELSKYCNHPSSLHVTMAKRVLRYLKGTRSFGLRYTGTDDSTLLGYVDASYADNVDTARSTTGYLFQMCGSVIDWRSTCQHTVARSSCESEYMALSDATTEALYLRNILPVFFPDATSSATRIHSDNQSAIKIGNCVAPTKLSKHINVRYHNVREQVVAETIEVKYISTNEQPADMLTKNLGRLKLMYFRSKILGD